MPPKPRANTQIAAEPDTPVRRPGRPSVASARRAEIVEAYAECIRAHGVAGATVSKLAQTLGLSRTLVFHYFGDMRTLRRAVVEHIVGAVIRDMTEDRKDLSVAARRQALIDFAVREPTLGDLRDIIVQADVNALAGHDEAVATMLSELWEVWVGAVADELGACFPQAERRQCEWVGYGLACLGETHWWLSFIGPGGRRREDARRVVESLIATLQTPGDTE